MNLLDRISKLELVPKIISCFIVAGGGAFILRIVFGLLSNVSSVFGFIGGLIGLIYVIYIVYRIFFKNK